MLDGHLKYCPIGKIDGIIEKIDGIFVDICGM